MAITRFFLKKKKEPSPTQKLKKFIGAEISAESAMIATGKVLVESMEIAKNKNDVDGLLAVADRWYNISRLILDHDSSVEEEPEKLPMGFIGGESANTTKDDTGEANDQSEGRA
jgi:hypothetical protein